MPTDPRSLDDRHFTRREVLKAAALAAGALGVARPAFAQAPKQGGVLISAQTTEATGLDPQLVPALSRSRRSPMMYSQLVRFDPEMNVVPDLA
jgi:ABC-type transport system substrate-binding protein